MLTAKLRERARVPGTDTLGHAPRFNLVRPEGCDGAMVLLYCSSKAGDIDAAQGRERGCLLSLKADVTDHAASPGGTMGSNHPDPSAAVSPALRSQLDGP